MGEDEYKDLVTHMQDNVNGIVLKCQNDQENEEEVGFQWGFFRVNPEYYWYFTGLVVYSRHFSVLQIKIQIPFSATLCFKGTTRGLNG